MNRNIIAPILAASIALTSINPAPAHADPQRDQIGGIIAGAIALFILSQAIEDKTTVQRRAQVQVPSPVPPAPRRSKPVRTSVVLPGDCYFDTRDRFGQRGVYGKRCLREEMRHPNKLPKRCEDLVRVRHGQRAKVYDARCLYRAGFKNDGWRH